MALTTHRKLEIRQAADSLLLASGIVRETPINTEAIARHLGYKVVAFTPDAVTAGISGAVHHGLKTIYINFEEKAVRQHFTLAHEIGHAVLHAGEDIVDLRDSLTSPRNDKEREANLFAAELLMPLDLFFPAWIKHEGDHRTLGGVFGVSPEAVRIRAAQFDLA